jgi:acetyl-CoA acetyltransferase
LTSARFGARGKVAIVGYAQSPIVRNSDAPLGALTIETCLRAIADAGLAKDQVDGFTTGALFPSSGGRGLVDGVHVVTADWLAERLRVQPRWLCGFQGIGQIPGAVVLATDAIASGAADYVVAYRAMYNPAGGYHENPMTRAEGDAQWVAPQGFWGPPMQMALPYMEYMQRYGATREDMSTVVVEARANGASIPWSHWQGKPITADDYLGSRMIAEPMSVLDCDIPVTGVGAFVLTSAERARDLPHRPVYVAGYAQGRWRPANGVQVWSVDDIFAGGREVARILWENTGLGPSDVELPQVYDGFSPFVYFWLEALGYCAKGEAHRFVQDGGIRTGVGLPVLSGGGALGNGRMHGVPQMLECYLQLSRRAGDRQLPGVEVGLACQAAPSLGGVVAYTSEPTG